MRVKNETRVAVAISRPEISTDRNRHRHRNSGSQRIPGSGYQPRQTHSQTDRQTLRPHYETRKGATKCFHFLRLLFLPARSAICLRQTHIYVMPRQGLGTLKLLPCPKKKKTKTIKREGRKALEVLALKFRETSWTWRPRRCTERKA